MAEDTTSTPGATPAGTPPVDPTTSDPGATPGTEKVTNPEALLAAHTAQKEQLKAAKALIAQQAAALKQIEDAKLSETERLTKRAADLEARQTALTTQHRATLVGLSVQVAAAQLGIIDPEAAAKLLDYSKLTFDEQGAPTNVDTALGALIAAKPYLKAGPGQRPASPTNPARQAPDNDRIWTQAEIADPSVWSKNREAITQAMREGRVR